jgi:hypothetical protein
MRQDFRLSAHLGDLGVQGATSFRTNAFTRGNLDLSGSWEGVSYRASLLISNLGSSETPSYDTGGVFRIAGVAAGVGYVSIAAGVGASPFGSVREGACFEGARILLSDLSLCGGKAAVDLLLGLAGPDTETITWQTTLAYHDLKLQTSLRFIDLFQFQGVAANMRVTIGGLLITGRFSFDSDLVFQSGNWSITAPLFGGSLTSATTFNATTLVSQNLTWSYWGDQLFVVITPMFDIVSSAAVTGRNSGIWGLSSGQQRRSSRVSPSPIPIPSKRASHLRDLASHFDLGKPGIQEEKRTRNLDLACLYRAVAKRSRQAK